MPAPSRNLRGAPEVVCVGETMAVVVPDHHASVEDAKEFFIATGGAESNVAIHLAHLGLGVAWLGRVGADPLGRRVLRTLADGGLDLRWVDVDEERPTGVYFKDSSAPGGARVHYYRAGSAAAAMAPADYDRWPVADARLVHTTGITAAISPSADGLVQRIIDGRGRAGHLVSFDVNFRPALWAGRDAGSRLAEIAGAADIVLVGLDEAQALWGVDTAEDVAALLPHVGHVVVKDGSVEAVEFVREPHGDHATHRVAALRVEVVEAVGAGDAFAAGFLGALLSGRGPEQRLADGHRLAALALQTNHDFALPAREEGAGQHEHTR